MDRSYHEFQNPNRPLTVEDFILAFKKGWCFPKRLGGPGISEPHDLNQNVYQNADIRNAIKEVFEACEYVQDEEDDSEMPFYNREDYKLKRREAINLARLDRNFKTFEEFDSLEERRRAVCNHLEIWKGGCRVVMEDYLRLGPLAETDKIKANNARNDTKGADLKIGTKTRKESSINSLLIEATGENGEQISVSEKNRTRKQRADPQPSKGRNREKVSINMNREPSRKRARRGTEAEIEAGGIKGLVTSTQDDPATQGRRKGGGKRGKLASLDKGK